MDLSNSLEGKKIVAHYVMYTHDFFFEESVESVIPFVDLILIAQTTKPWFGKEVDLTKTNLILDKLKEKHPNKLEIFKDKFENEQSQRNFLIEKSHDLGHDGAFIIDCDEIFVEDSFNKIYEFIAQNSPKALRIPYLTFIKDASFVVAPPYEDGIFYIDLNSDVEFSWARNVTVAVTSMPYEKPEILHFSYLRESDEAILNKVKSFMHIHDTDWDYWYNNIYLNVNPNIQNFHPVWPERWKALELFDSDKLPRGLYQKLLKNKQLFFNQKIKNNEAIKLHLGCGPLVKEGYVNIDLFDEHADIKMDITNLTYFETNSVDEIYMNAVFEHLYTFEQDKALAEWFRVLKKGGKLIINSTPDFDEVIKAYINKAKGNWGEVFNLYEVFRYTHGDYKEENKIGQIHKDIFTKEKMRCLVENAGFEVEKIESICWGNEPNPVNLDLIAVKTVKSIDSNLITKKIIEAESFIGCEEYLKAKIILEDILSIDNNIDALNDLAVIALLENDIDNAANYLNKVLSLDKKNEIALENLKYLSENFNKKLLSLKIDKPYDQNLLATLPSIEFKKIGSFNDFVDYNNSMKNEYLARNKYEKSLLQNEQEFSVRGICISCKKEEDFLVDYWNSYETSEGKIPNWRERLVCPECQLNNRMRLSLHLIAESNQDLLKSKVYIAEQTTPTYSKLKNSCKELVGSEYISNSIPFGTVNNHGIRNEDFTSLTFNNEEFDLVLSFDVFEHIYDYKAAFAESFRILKNGGSLLFTVPFDRNSEKNIIRAKIQSDGTIDHILSPEYHGDPMNISEGCLCFYHFGWEMLKDLEEVGFTDAYSLFCYSKEYGYLGGDQIFFVATKSETNEKKSMDSLNEMRNKLILEAEELIELNQLDHAKDILNTILLVEPYNIDCLIDIAVIEIMNNNFNDAKDKLNIVLNVDPGNQLAKENLIYLCEQLILNQNQIGNQKNNYNLKRVNTVKKKTLSVNLLVFNEIDFIEAWLNNTVPFVDEVVIIDGGSTDGTIEKITKYNSPKIKIFNWKQESTWYSKGWNESARRNLALIQSSGDWILKKDVDEFFHEEDYQILREVIENNDNNIYCFPRYNFWGSKNYVRENTDDDMHWYPDYQGNLWNSHIGLTYSDQTLHCYLRLGDEMYNKTKLLNHVHIYHYHWSLGKKIKINDLRRGDLLTDQNMNKMPNEEEDKLIDLQLLNWKKEGIKTSKFEGVHPKLLT